MAKIAQPPKIKTFPKGSLNACNQEVDFNFLDNNNILNQGDSLYLDAFNFSNCEYSSVNFSFSGEFGAMDRDGSNGNERLVLDFFHLVSIDDEPNDQNNFFRYDTTNAYGGDVNSSSIPVNCNSIFNTPGPVVIYIRVTVAECAAWDPNAPGEYGPHYSVKTGAQTIIWTPVLTSKKRNLK